MKKVIKLTESDLVNIIRRVVNEQKTAGSMTDRRGPINMAALRKYGKKPTPLPAKITDCGGRRPCSGGCCDDLSECIAGLCVPQAFIDMIFTVFAFEDTLTADKEFNLFEQSSGTTKTPTKTPRKLSQSELVAIAKKHGVKRPPQPGQPAQTSGCNPPNCYVGETCIAGWCVNNYIIESYVYYQNFFH